MWLLQEPVLNVEEMFDFTLSSDEGKFQGDLEDDTDTFINPLSYEDGGFVGKVLYFHARFLVLPPLPPRVLLLYFLWYSECSRYVKITPEASIPKDRKKGVIDGDQVGYSMGLVSPFEVREPRASLSSSRVHPPN